MRFIVFLIIFCIFVAVTAQTGPSHGKVVACYGWSNRMLSYMRANIRDEVAPFDDVDLSMCTHVHPFFKATDSWNFTSSEDEDEYKQLTRLKLKYPHLKIMMLTEFRYIAQFYGSSVQYQELIERITSFLLRFDFDGLDIIKQGFYDFKNQSARHVATVKELRKRFQQFNLQLMVTWGIKDGDQSYLPLSKYVDYMPVLGSTGFYSSTEEAISDLHIMNMEKRINEIVSTGFPSSKLVMNLDFVGYPIRRSDSDPFSGGQWPFNQICKLTSNNESSIWSRHFHTAANVAMLQNKNENSEVREAIFQSTRSIANLARLAMKFRLAGLAAVPVNFDDFRGKCGLDEDTFNDFKPTTKFSSDILKRKFALLRTINVSINVTLDEIRNESKPVNNSSGNRLSNFFCRFFYVCC